MKKMTSLVGKGFQPAKCKTQLRLGSSRIKLLRNKKGTQIAADRTAVAGFLRNGQESSARLRVEHVIREQNLIEAYDLLFLYAERIAAQLPVIDSQKTCPPELKEDISTLLFASSRCAELPDFAQIRPMFIAKYGKEFVSAIEELRPGCGVNGRVIEKLSVSRASGEAKLQVMKDIAAEHKVDWDPAPFEKELRTSPNDLLDGPSKIMSAEDFDDFPTVPNQKPVLTQVDNLTNSISGRSMEVKVEPKNSPRPADDFRTSSQGGRTGPPARKPSGLSPPTREDPPFDTDMDPGARENVPRRSSRRESDSFTALSRPQEEESRRNSIGVPREKTGRVTAAPVFRGIDESPPKDFIKHNRRGSIDEFDGSLRAERRQSQKYEGQKHASDEDEHGGFAKSRLGTERSQTRRAQDPEEDNYSTVSGSGKTRSHKPDDEEYYKRVPSREKYEGRAQSKHTSDEDEHGGFAKSRPGTERPQTRRAQDPEEDNYSTVSGSGKARSHKQDDEEHYKRVPSREKYEGRAQSKHTSDEDEHGGFAKSRPGTERPQTRRAQDPEEDNYSTVTGSGKARSHKHDDEEHYKRVPSREKYEGRTQSKHTSDEDEHGGFAKSRPGTERPQTRRAQDLGEDNYGTVSGSGKARSHKKDDEEHYERVSSRDKEGSGKGRTHHEDQYAEEQNLRRSSSKEGSGSKIPSSLSEESRRSKEGSQYAGKYRTHDYSDEEADHIPERPRRSDPTKYAPKYVDEDPERFKKFVTIRNPEDEYRDSPRGTRRESLNTKARASPRGEDNGRRPYADADNGRRPYADEDNGRRPYADDDNGKSPYADDDSGKRPYADDTSVKRSNLAGRRKENERFTPQYDSSESEDGPRGSRKVTNNFHTDRSSGSGEEGSRQSRTPRLPSVTEQRKDSPRGSRYGREDAAPRNSRFDNDKSLPTSSRTEMRMSLPGEKPKYRASDAYDDNRRATIGPEEITRGARESQDRREKEKHSDRRPKDDIMEGRQSSSHASQRDRSDRRRLSDDGDRPPRFLTPKVDDERSPKRERPERPRKNTPPRYDDDKRPPRFIKVGKQDDQDSSKPKQSTPRPRSNLQSHKTDPDLPKTPKVEHRKTHSASDGQPPSKPVFMKPPDLDVLLKMFGDKKK